jgi:hypothetical protein
MARKRKAKPEADSRFDFSDEQRADQSGLVWWDPAAEDGERGRVMVEVAQQIETSPSEMLRQDLNLLYGSLYEGTGLANMYQYGGRATLNAIANGNGIVTGESTWNQIRSVVNTVSSQVSRSKPRARFVASNGDYLQEERAKKRTMLCDGLFNLERVYEKTQRAFTAAGVFDCAGVETIRGKTRPEVELVMATEILIDPNDGIYGAPRSMYRRKFIDRAIVLRKWGDTEERKRAIMQAQAEDPTVQGGRANLIRVYEAWHLPAEKGGKDGRHVIAIKGEGGTLIDETWEKDYFSIRLFTWDPALSGPYGRSAAEVLLPNQVAINVLLDKIARAQHLACVPRVGIQRGSKILKSEITNGIGSVIQFGTMPPVWWSPTALSPEVYQHLERHWAKGFESYGVSPSLASGQKATGTVSGEAIRESLDVQTARFAVLSQRWEQLHLDVARQMLDICREIYADDPSKPLGIPGTELPGDVKFADLDMDDDAYVIQEYPTSLLPQTPQGRIDRVGELVDRGIWSTKRAEAALDDLDVESEMSADLANEKEAKKICQDILSFGKYRTPDPAMDLTTCLRVGASYRAIAETKRGIPGKHIDLLYKWLDDVAAAQQAVKPQPAPPAPGMPPGAPPPAAAPAPMPAAA